MKVFSFIVRCVRNVVRCVRNNPKLAWTVLVVLAVAIAYFCGYNEGSVLAAAIVPGVAGGKHVVDGPLTTDLTREASPSLLLNEVDRQIVKIRPMATPIDQISRYAGSKHAGAMQVDYYNVDTKPTVTTLSEDYDESTATTTGSMKVVIKTANDDMFDASDTILVQGVYGYSPDGETLTYDELVL